MFGLISTKNLYLIKLDMVTDYKYVSSMDGCYSLANNPRFTLAKKDCQYFIDIFTGTEYSSSINERKETIVEARSIITTRKYITAKEAEFLLQELNPTYLNAKRFIIKPR